MLTGTVFNYSCPTRKFFENTYSGQLENKCYSTEEGKAPHWLYNTSSPPLICVGNIQYNSKYLNKFILYLLFRSIILLYHLDTCTLSDLDDLLIFVPQANLSEFPVNSKVKYELFSITYLIITYDFVVNCSMSSWI